MKPNYLLHISAGTLLLASTALAVPVSSSDDFESGHTIGAIPVGWSTKDADTQVPPQDALFTVESGNGLGGSQGLALDVATAIRAYSTMFGSGVTGDTIVVESEVQFGITGGDALENHPFIGLKVSTTGGWWDGTNVGFALVRRNGADDHFGVVLTGGAVHGWEPHSKLGLPATNVVGDSDWITLRMVLTDNGDDTWDAVGYVINNGQALITTPVMTYAAPSGSTLYGGLETNWNNTGTGSIATYCAVSDVDADNFSMVGGSSSIDADGDGLTEAEEVGLGTDDENKDSDGDQYTDKIEVDNGSDPTDSSSVPGNVLFAGFTAAEGYVDGNLNGQKDWLGHNVCQVDATAGTATTIGSGAWDRNCNALGVLGSTGGDPSTATGLFDDGDVIRITFDYQFTLPASGNNELALVGFRNEGPTADNGWNTAPQQGFKLAFDASDPTIGGLVKFFPDMADSTNADALLLQGQDFGLNPGADPGIGGGVLDLASDVFRVTYVAQVVDFTGINFEVVRFEVTNLTTMASWSYDLVTTPQAFTYVPADSGEDAFYAQLLGPTVNAVESAAHRVVVDYGLATGVDLDGDTLPQATEMTLGTSDGDADTDGDTFNDNVEVGAGTDPTDPNSFPGAPVGGLVDFNNDASGNMALPPWSETYEVGGDATQKLLFQVASGAGLASSKGVTLDAATAKQGYKMKNTELDAGGSAGDVVQLTCDFQIGITDTAPATENLAPIGLMLSADPDWFEGTSIYFNLVRRDAGKRYGVSMTGLATPAGWEANSEIGLPDTLGTPATSDWFTMRLTAKDNGDDTWDVHGEILNGSVVVFETNSTVTSIPSLTTLYGGVTVGNFGETPAVSSVAVATQTSSVALDNFSVFTHSASENNDPDTLTQAEEAWIGTSDLNEDTDGDTFNDDVEVAAGTDPLDPLDFPSTPGSDPVITSITRSGTTATIVMEGKATTTYVCKSSLTLTGFTAIATDPVVVTTDVNGDATFTVDATEGVKFFLVEE